MTAARTVRELLQWYGTDVIRKKDPDHWVELMDMKLLEAKHNGVKLVLIGDVRFPNEVDLVDGYEGKVIRLLPYSKWDKHSDHESETALDDYKDFWLTIAPPFGTLRATAEYVRSIL